MDERLNIKDFKGKFRGERVWIVGSGPSIDNTPLDLIEDEYSFGMNGIGQVFDCTSWRPRFFVCATAYASKKDYRNYVLRAVENCEIAVFCDRLLPMISNHIPLGSYHKVVWLKCLQNSSERNDPRDEWWNPLMVERNKINNFGTSAFACTQIAAYLGFETMIFVGCDMGYKSFKAGEPDPNHFGDQHESGELSMPQVIHDLENPRRFESHEIIKRRAEKVGIKVYNATIGGELEVYERVDYLKMASERWA